MSRCTLARPVIVGRRILGAKGVSAASHACGARKGPQGKGDGSKVLTQILADGVMEGAIRGAVIGGAIGACVGVAMWLFKKKQ